MPNFTRRQFLEESLAVATATLGALTAADRARAADPAPNPPFVAPHNRLGVACVGLNGRGQNHMDAYLAMPDVDLLALCDVDLNVARKQADRVKQKTGKAPRVYQDLRQLYQDPDVRAVSLAMPIHWHALATMWAVQAGKDVYCEKPVCHNIHEGYLAGRDASNRYRIAQGGTQSRSHAAMRDAIAYLHAEELGKVRLARGLCYKRRTSIGILPNAPVPDGVDYNIWLGPAPERPFNPNRFHYNWHWNWEYGAGDLGNQGIHQMDIARWALNEVTLPRAVVAAGGRFGYLDQGQTPNTAVVMFDYPGHPLIFEVRGLVTPKFEGVDIGDLIYAEHGYVAFTSNYAAAAAFDNDHKLIKEFKGGGDHFRNFVDAVKIFNAALLNAPYEQAFLSSALCHMGNISYRLGADAPFDRPGSAMEPPAGESAEATDAFIRMKEHLMANGVDLDHTPYRRGKYLRFDPLKRVFTESQTANRFLSREYREPFTLPTVTG